MVQREQNTNISLTREVRKEMMAKKLNDGTIKPYDFYDDEDDSDDDTKIIDQIKTKLNIT